MASGDDVIARAARAIAAADMLFIGAGAGMSADSGLMVFGQLSSLPALQSQGLTYDQIASLDMFCKNTRQFLGFWLAGTSAYQSATPHAV